MPATPLQKGTSLVQVGKMRLGEIRVREMVLSHWHYYSCQQFKIMKHNEDIKTARHIGHNTIHY